MTEMQALPTPGSQMRVLKRNLAGEVIWQYEGRVLRCDSESVVLEAFFNLPDMPMVDAAFKRGDRFVETFYSARWYNIFEIFDRDDGKRKGWYCNISKPAELQRGIVSWVDLALDLWVAADGKQTLLDEDEFETLELDPAAKRTAWSAVEELRERFNAQNPS